MRTKPKYYLIKITFWFCSYYKTVAEILDVKMWKAETTNSYLTEKDYKMFSPK